MSRPNAPILQVEHLTMRFGGLTAIDDLSFTATRGDITAIIGPNGAGKTTVFNCITGFYKPTQGMLSLTQPDGEQFLLERLEDHEISSTARVARTFQNIRLFSGMTVLENLLVAQHRPLGEASFFSLRAFSVLPATARPRPKRSSSPPIGLKNYASSTAPTMRQAICLMARRGGLKSRARCARVPCCSVWTSRPPASTLARAPS